MSSAVLCSRLISHWDSTRGHTSCKQLFPTQNTPFMQMWIRKKVGRSWNHGNRSICVGLGRHREKFLWQNEQLVSLVPKLGVGVDVISNSERFSRTKTSDSSFGTFDNMWFVKMLKEMRVWKFEFSRWKSFLNVTSFWLIWKLFMKLSTKILFYFYISYTWPTA